MSASTPACNNTDYAFPFITMRKRTAKPQSTIISLMLRLFILLFNPKLIVFFSLCGSFLNVVGR